MPSFLILVLSVDVDQTIAMLDIGNVETRRRIQLFENLFPGAITTNVKSVVNRESKQTR